jgi:hypothetical protein
MRSDWSAPALVCAAALVLLGSACVSPAPKAEAMTAIGVVAPNKHAGAVDVAVAGGGGLVFRISDAAFEEAVEASLLSSRVFSGVVELDDATYRLQAILGDTRQPAAGTSFTVEMHVLWTLWRADEPSPVWQSLVKSSDRRGVGDAFNAQNRLRLATEMAARANITEAIQQISAASF